jgi:hypothetical protein
MFAVPNTQHSQIAYVTNDLDAAASQLEKEYGIPGFYKFDNFAVAQPSDPQLRIALARVGGVEVELIEPQGDVANLFADVLPKDRNAGLAIRFHHIAIRIGGSLEDWQRHTLAIDTTRHRIVFQGALADQMRFFYTDERSTLGHYVEHVWLHPALLEQLGYAIPTYPPPA